MVFFYQASGKSVDKMLSGRFLILSLLVSLCLLGTFVEEVEGQLGGFLFGVVVGKLIG